MSKQPPPSYSAHTGEHPPPYTLAGDLPSTSTYHAPGVPGLFSSHLNSLRDRIVSHEVHRSQTREQLDNQILSLLVPYIEDLLSSIAQLDPAPTSVQVTLVPNSAVGKDWVLSDATEKGRGELRSVVRVQRDSKISGDEKRRPSPPPSTVLDSSLSLETPREFSEWGRWDEDGSSSKSKAPLTLWWDDEGMAIRLTKSLQPVKRVDRATVHQNTTQTKAAQKSSSRLVGLFKRDVPVPGLADRGRAPQQQQQQQQQQADEEEDVTMNVAAEEVTFRRENEMGIWESCRGWGIVVTVKIRQV